MMLFSWFLSAAIAILAHVARSDAQAASTVTFTVASNVKLVIVTAAPAMAPAMAVAGAAGVAVAPTTVVAAAITSVAAVPVIKPSSAAAAVTPPTLVQSRPATTQTAAASTMAALTGATTGATMGGIVVFEGRLATYKTSTDFDLWSFSNRVPQFQTYIHGANVLPSQHLTLGPAFKNPVDAKSANGVQVTIDAASQGFNGQLFWRTELIPELGQQGTNNAGTFTGLLYFHFSLSPGGNPPNLAHEHQLVFFEQHFAELKLGTPSGQAQSATSAMLQFYINGQQVFTAPHTAGVWNNFAMAVDFTANTVALYQSTGAGMLNMVVMPTAVQTTPIDWHVGCLRLPINGATQSPGSTDFLYSGIYIEKGALCVNPAGC
ncbi:hypothetical protein HK101_011153 [Irineochytrium annulatum]|nr:hypothetical protein HK101_011153 [Irineochytrium annulatum]